MSFPKVITLKVSPSKSTLSFDVLEPSKVVMESQPTTTYSFAAPARAMNITTEPIDDATVPSLVDDATSSGMPSEDSLAMDSEYDGVNSSGHSWAGDVSSSTNSVLASHRGRDVRSQAGSSEHELHLSVSTISSGSDDDADVEDSTTPELRSVIKTPTALARRGRKGRKGSTTHDKSHKSHKSPSTSDTDDSVSQRTDRRHDKTSRWGDSQDALLKSMKEGGETWATIATALGRGKKDVQQRFKEIKSARKEGAGEAPRKEKARTGAKSWSSNKSSKKRSRAHRKSTPHLSWSSEAESTSASPDPESIDSDAQQQIYLQDQIRENLYPPYLSLEEDDHFTKRDCEVLATVDSKMKRGKWLEMQANFFNVTGKMVPISVFRDKCEAAEAEERQRIREVKIRSWKAGLDYSVQFDPNEPCRIA